MRQSKPIAAVAAIAHINERQADDAVAAIVEHITNAMGQASVRSLSRRGWLVAGTTLVVAP